MYLYSHVSLWRTIGLTGLMVLTLGLFGCDQAAEEDTEAATASTTETQSTEPEAPSTPVATTQYGQVRGLVEEGVNVFKGIRYGADTATTRFQPPAIPEPWDAIQDTLTYANSCPQVPTGLGGGLFSSWRPEPMPALAEDCLFLNVWTPALRDDAKRPVLVWFHGGGFTSGSGSSLVYDGVNLANRGDVVVVTVNHRLNHFGYTYLGEYSDKFADSGNAGMLDLVLSLEWVRDNIREFGGDPNNVLIFGESGGGAKVSTLMAMDDAKGLFHKAVIQSGPAITLREQDAAEEAAAALVAELGLTADTIEQILAMPLDKIEAAARKVAQEESLVAGSSPVVDGRTLKRHPFAEGAPPQSADVPLLIGTTRTEYSLLLGARNPELFDLTWETLPDELASYVDDKDVDEVIAKYRELNPEIDAPELFFTATSDARFLNGSVELASKKSNQQGAPTYFYLLNWNTPVDGGKWLAPHALEIGMVFDNVEKSESMSGISPEAQRIADLMSEAWLAFAKTGDPHHQDLPEWPSYNDDDYPVMVFDLEPEVVNDPHGEQRRMFLD